MAKIILNRGDGFYSWSLAGAKSVFDLKMETPNVNISEMKDLLGEILTAKQEGKDSITTYAIDREDPEAIAILESCGSEYCSPEGVKLGIKKYDETRYRPLVRNYDGFEFLDLMPYVSADTLRACGSVDKIIELLEVIGVAYEEED